ncbi:MAG: hypothetical protein ACD_22C00142G0004 [uncultured bacterium]|nr:MAG: hypothetical protein ACD_22C00142G0004 [uncultured bacterium]
MDIQNQTQNSSDTVMKIGKYEVRVLRDLCIGAASCVAVSPQVFVLDGENKAVFAEGASDLPENIVLAAESCPTRAIVIIDIETGEQVWPK